MAQEGILLRLTHPDGRCAVVFDDNGMVAYAYFVEDQQIVGDVWLYNRCAAPKEPEWRSAERAPFANAAQYVAQVPFAPPSFAGEIEVRWSGGGRAGNVRAQVFIRGVLHATLARNERPGACRLAAKDGPLARVLVEPDTADSAQGSTPDGPECR